MGYVNMFGFFLLFLSTGLTVCYSFRLFYIVMCGDFNFFSSYSMSETNLYTNLHGVIPQNTRISMIRTSNVSIFR
jgi:hypothetical protein